MDTSGFVYIMFSKLQLFIYTIQGDIENISSFGKNFFSIINTHFVLIYFVIVIVIIFLFSSFI